MRLIFVNLFEFIRNFLLIIIKKMMKNRFFPRIGPLPCFLFFPFLFPFFLLSGSALSLPAFSFLSLCLTTIDFRRPSEAAEPSSFSSSTHSSCLCTSVARRTAEARRSCHRRLLTSAIEGNGSLNLGLQNPQGNSS